MADFAQAFFQGRQIGQQNRLAQLSSQAYNTAPEGQNALLSQIAEVSPQAAQGQQQQFQQQEDRTGQQLRGYVDFVNNARKSGNPQAVNAALRAGAPLIQRLTGNPAPTEWSPEMDAGWAELEAKVAMTPGAAGGNAVQSTFVDGDGNRVAIYRDGRTAVLGKNDAGATQQSLTITGPDGRPAQYTFDRRTGGYMPAGAAMAPQAAQTTRFTGPDGMPVEIGNDVPEHVRQQILANPQAFQEVPDGTQAQMPDRPVGQFSGGNQLRTTQQVVNGPSPFVGQSPAERAASEAAARAGVELQYSPVIAEATERARLSVLPDRQNIENQGAIDRATGLQRVENAAETISSAPAAIATMQQSIDSIDSLLASPNLGSVVGLGSINPLNRIPGTEGRGLIARADQVGGQAFLAAFNQLKGGGAITEKEGEAATRAMARLDRTQSESDYRAALRDLKSAVAPAIARQRQALSRAQQAVGASQPAQSVQRARNPQTGEVLELRNGQWVPAR